MFLRCFVLFLAVTHVFALELLRRQSCQLKGHTRTLHIPDCVDVRVTTNACRGYCESWSLPSIMFGYKQHPVTSLGQCCNIIESEEVPVKVLCIDGERTLTLKSALKCDCYRCQKE